MKSRLTNILLCFYLNSVCVIKTKNQNKYGAHHILIRKTQDFFYKKLLISRDLNAFFLELKDYFERQKIYVLYILI